MHMYTTYMYTNNNNGVMGRRLAGNHTKNESIYLKLTVLSQVKIYIAGDIKTHKYLLTYIYIYKIYVYLYKDM